MSDPRTDLDDALRRRYQGRDALDDAVGHPAVAKLWEYQSDRLTGTEASAIAAHLAACGECAREAALASIALDAGGSTDESIATRAMQRVPRRFAWRVVAAAATLAAGVLIALLLWSGDRSLAFQVELRRDPSAGAAEPAQLIHITAPLPRRGAVGLVILIEREGGLGIVTDHISADRLRVENGGFTLEWPGVTGVPQPIPAKGGIAAVLAIDEDGRELTPAALRRVRETIEDAFTQFEDDARRTAASLLLERADRVGTSLAR